MFSTIFLQASPLEGMLPMLIMVGAMFLLFLWPQMRKQKKEKQFQEALKPGAKVVTTSGMHAKILQIMDDGVILETMSGKLKFERAAISREFTEARFPETVGK
jgi:preprotein translocase subunit YajC